MSAAERWKAIQDKAVFYADLQRSGEEWCWASEAARYHQRRLASPALAWECEQLLAEIEPGGSVLEIGAGTGVHTVPLAARAGRVVAVEPSPAQRAVLVQSLAASGISNVEIIPSRFEDADDLEPCDVVVAAGCLYCFYDIGAVLGKMRRLATQAIVLTQVEGGARLGGALYERCAEVLGLSSPCGPSPDLVDLFDVMCELGLHPSVRLRRVKTGGAEGRVFRRLDEAVTIFANRLAVPPERHGELRALLERELVACADGYCYPPGIGQVAVLVHRCDEKPLGREA